MGKSSEVDFRPCQALPNHEKVGSSSGAHQIVAPPRNPTMRAHSECVLIVPSMVEEGIKGKNFLFLYHSPDSSWSTHFPVLTHLHSREVLAIRFEGTLSDNDMASVYTEVLSCGRNYDNSQSANQNKQDAISKVSAIQDSARGPR